jgi:hypothetical protein
MHLLLKEKIIMDNQELIDAYLILKKYKKSFEILVWETFELKQKNRKVYKNEQYYLVCKN